MKTLNMEKTNNYYWHGEPVKTTFGYVEVREVKEKPLYWFNYEINNKSVTGDYTHEGGKAFLDAIQIETKSGEVFYIANHFGIGVNKLIKGGWPNSAHFSFPENGFIKFIPDDKTQRGLNGEFNEPEYALHESNRRKWYKENYPEEFERSEKLRKMIQK